MMQYSSATNSVMLDSSSRNLYYILEFPWNQLAVHQTISSILDESLSKTTILCDNITPTGRQEGHNIDLNYTNNWI